MLSRPYQELSNGMLGFEQALKIALAVAGGFGALLVEAFDILSGLRPYPNY